MIGVIGFGGEPATGKSTLMRFFLDFRNSQPQKFGGVPVSCFAGNLIVIGEYPPGEKFGGTDRLSMSIQPSVEKMLAKAERETSVHGAIFLYEGDRIFNGKMLRFIKGLDVPNYFFVLQAGQEELKRRHADRKDDQGEKWLAGRRSKIARLIEEFGLDVYQNNSGDRLPELAAMLNARIVELRESILALKR